MKLRDERARPAGDFPPRTLTGVSCPPPVDELITDDGEAMESSRHVDGMNLLIETLDLQWEDRSDYFAGGNMFLYFSMLQTKRNDFRGPDVFVVLGTEKRERKAWVMWQEEGKRPSVIIELTSPSTVREDRGRKKEIYERALEVPFYFLFDPETGELEGFRLPGAGARYEPIVLNGAGRLPVEALGLELGVWHGRHRYTEAPWARWYLPDGALLPSRAEAHAAAQARADEAQARADEASARAAELERRLAALERRAPPAEE